MMPFKEMARLNKVSHEPARLAITSALAACKMAEFLFLQELTGLTTVNLSCHLSNLQKAGYLVIDNKFIRTNIPHTSIQITAAGRTAIEQHWDQLERIREVTKQWNNSAHRLEKL